MSQNFIIELKKEHLMGELLIVQKPEDLKSVTSEISLKLLKIMKNPSCPMDIARELGIHEQKIYYYIKKLKDAGIIEEVGSEKRYGTLARFYEVKHSAIGIKIPGAKMGKMNFSAPKYNKNLEPFITKGKINFTMVVGSPEPHGPFRARAADASCAIDLGLFLGSFTSGMDGSNYKLDVEMRERDLKENLIIIGGPAANMISKKVEKYIPIKILMRKDRSIYSTVSKRKYENDNCGYIVVSDNPWSKGKKIILFAGKRFPGTRASILFMIKKIDKIFEGNKFNKKIIAKVVKGYDMNGDGRIDTAEIME